MHLELRYFFKHALKVIIGCLSCLLKMRYMEGNQYFVELRIFERILNDQINRLKCLKVENTTIK